MTLVSTTNNIGCDTEFILTEDHLYIYYEQYSPQNCSLGNFMFPWTSVREKKNWGALGHFTSNIAVKFPEEWLQIRQIHFPFNCRLTYNRPVLSFIVKYILQMLQCSYTTLLFILFLRHFPCVVLFTCPVKSKGVHMHAENLEEQRYSSTYS